VGISKTDVSSEYLRSVKARFLDHAEWMQNLRTKLEGRIEAYRNSLEKLNTDHVINK
jgi:hypothetical protein